MAKAVYLDHAATTPVRPEVLEAMWPYFAEHFGNASSRNHAFGWTAAEAVDVARERVAGLIGAEPSEIVFTSGATEALNTAIKGVAQAYAAKGRHLLTLATEHKAVLDVYARLARKGNASSAGHHEGCAAELLPVDRNGLLDPAALADRLRDDTVLVACMLGNNETGVRQDIGAIAEQVHARGSLLLVDATQAVGKVPVVVQELGADLLALSAHKFGGPKGVGALYVRRRNPRVRITPLLDGGGHERGRRSGTLNVPGIVGLGMAAELARRELLASGERLRALREHLESLAAQQLQARVHAADVERLPHIANLCLPGLLDAGQKAEAMLARVQGQLAASTASACSSASLEPSHVLLAMGLSPAEADASIRLSLGWNSTEADVERAIAVLAEAL